MSNDAWRDTSTCNHPDGYTVVECIGGPRDGWWTTRPCTCLDMVMLGPAGAGVHGWYRAEPHDYAGPVWPGPVVLRWHAATNPHPHAHNIQPAHLPLCDPAPWPEPDA